MSIPFNLKGTNLTVDEKTRDYLEQKLNSLERLLSSSDHSSIKCQAELGKITDHHASGKIFRAEINLSVGGAMFRAVAEEVSLESAIDVAKDDLKRELGKHKDKGQSILRRSGARIKQFLRFGREN
jgi:ribosomal subunit interface protein